MNFWACISILSLALLKGSHGQVNYLDVIEIGDVIVTEHFIDWEWTLENATGNAEWIWLTYTDVDEETPPALYCYVPATESSTLNSTNCTDFAKQDPFDTCTCMEMTVSPQNSSFVDIGTPGLGRACTLPEKGTTLTINCTAGKDINGNNAIYVTWDDLGDICLQYIVNYVGESKGDANLFQTYKYSQEGGRQGVAYTSIVDYVHFDITVNATHRDVHSYVLFDECSIDTLEGEPTSPQDFKITEVTGTTAELSWKAPKIIPGSLTKYEVEWWCADMSSAQTVEVSPTDEVWQTYTITELTPATSYRASVRAATTEYGTANLDSFSTELTGLTSSQIAGIVCGVLIAVILAVVGVICFVKREAIQNRWRSR